MTSVEVKVSEEKKMTSFLDDTTSRIETPQLQLPFSHDKSEGFSPTSSSNGTGAFFANDQRLVSMLNMEGQKLFIADIYQDFGLQIEESCLHLNDQEYIVMIKEFHEKLDKVKNIVKPGCSHEVLNTALTYISSLAGILSAKSSKVNLHASL